MLTLSELYMSKTIEELLRNESAVQYLERPVVSNIIMSTRWRQKDSLAFSLTKPSRSSNHVKIC